MMIHALLCLLLLLLSPVKTSATPPQKIYIHSQTAHHQHQTNTTLFTGQVIVDQGQAHLQAERLWVYTNQHNKKLKKMIAYGFQQPAHYWIFTKNKPPLHLYAKKMTFYPLSSILILQKNGIVKQGHQRLRSQVVIYNHSSGTVLIPPTQHNRAILTNYQQ